jgi:hypothetical protein
VLEGLKRSVDDPSGRRDTVAELLTEPTERCGEGVGRFRPHLRPGSEIEVSASEALEWGQRNATSSRLAALRLGGANEGGCVVHELWKFTPDASSSV